jgi:DNA-binding transcriptional LysR family regulator
MKIEYLLCFEAIKKYGNFSEAAENLYISQSGLSKQLKAFENELGVKLFERNRSPIKLTPIGERISVYVNNILNVYDTMILETKEHIKIERKKMRIASFYEMSQYGIADLLVAFEHNKPNFYIESRECSHVEMLDLLDNRKTDLVIGYREFWPQNINYYSIPLKKDDLVLVVHDNHPLAINESISIKAVKEERFCFPREDSALFRLFYNTCVINGFIPKLTLSDVRLGTIKRYILAGMRVTLQTRIRATNFFYEKEFHLINIKETPLLTLTILTNKDSLPKIGQQFIQFAKKYYKQKN